MADAWAELDALKKNEIDTGKVGSAQFFGTAADLQGQLPVPHGGCGARHLRQHRRRGHLSELRRSTRRAPPLTGADNYTVPLRAGPVAARQRVLVADHVRTAAEPAGGQPDQPVPDQLADGAEPDQGSRRWHTRSTSRHESPGPGQGEPTGCPPRRGRSQVVLRLYWPKPDALNGTWKAPKPVKA